MASNPVSICNSGLIKIGATRINALTDLTKEARLCNEQYDKLRKKVLRDHPWNFAVTRVSLAQTLNTPAFEYAFEYAIPSDSLRVIDTNLIEGEPWEVEVSQTSGNQVLVTNAGSVKIKYIKNITDTTLFSADFDEALSMLIGADLAYSLLQSSSMQQNILGAYMRFIATARSMDAQEGSRRVIEANEWIDIRN
jgi:DNA polymerase elongation subunit (family B)